MDAEGRFEVQIGELEPGPFELRLRCCHVNGDSSMIEFQYRLDDSLTLSPAAFHRQFLHQKYIEPARTAHDSAKVLAGVERLKGEDDYWYQKAQAVYNLLTRKPQPLQNLAAIGDEVHEVQLSMVQWESAKVWGAEPTCDGSPDAVPLESAERIHEHGLYAHADSSYVYRLGGKWKKLDAYYTLQNWIPGTVVFVIKCDGQEKLRSPLIRLWDEGHAELDLTGVDKLELIVEDGDNGLWDDDSDWLSPRLLR